MADLVVGTFLRIREKIGNTSVCVTLYAYGIIMREINILLATEPGSAVGML